MQGYIQVAPQGTEWQQAFFSEVMVDDKWLPLFDQYIVRRQPIVGTMSEIQRKAKEGFGDITVYVTEDNRICFGDIPLQSIWQQCKGVVRRIKKHLALILGC